MQYFLVMDAGTTSIKAGLISLDGKFADIQNEPAEVLMPFPGATEMDMDAVWEVAKKVILKLKNNNEAIWQDVAAMGISAQGDGLWCIDAKGRPVRNAMLWNDTRTVMDYDAVIWGNHDVETGHPVYDRVAREIKGYGIPFLGGNAIRNDDGKTYSTAFIIDGDRYSYWATDDAKTSATLEIKLQSPAKFDLIQLRENIKLGQRIDSVSVERWENNSWKPLAKATSIGANPGALNISRLPNATTAPCWRVWISLAATRTRGH